jgi:predicted TIM-barrel fold metal-dependent hydrolase
VCVVERFPAGVPVPLEAYPASDEQVPAFLEAVSVPGIVDVHVHAMPDRLQQAVWRYFDGLDDPPWPIRYRDGLEARLDQLRSFGVLAHTALAYAHRPGMLDWLNGFTLDLADAHQQVVPTFTVYPEEGVTDAVADALARGGVVCKVHTQLSRYVLDHPALTDSWRLMEEARTLVVAHTSAVYGVEGGRETSGGAQVARVRSAHPDLRLCIAHLGLPDPDGSQWRAIEHLDGVWTDVSAALVEPPAAVAPVDGPDDRALVRRLGSSLLFGSDFPSVPYSYADQLRGLGRLGLDPDALRAVLHDRAVGLLAEAGWAPPSTVDGPTAASQEATS